MITKEEATALGIGVAIGVVGTYAITFARLGRAILHNRKHYASVMELHNQIWEYLAEVTDDDDPAEISKKVIEQLEFIKQIAIY